MKNFLLLSLLALSFMFTIMVQFAFGNSVPLPIPTSPPVACANGITPSGCSLQGCSFAKCGTSCICTHCATYDPTSTTYACFNDGDCKSGACNGGDPSTCQIGQCSPVPSPTPSGGTSSTSSTGGPPPPPIACMTDADCTPPLTCINYICQ